MVELGGDVLISRNGSWEKGGEGCRIEMQWSGTKWN